ncbi:MAG: hypothetical protein ABIJ92_02775 [Candidatus Aenigmatarchaeota archaeon]
MLDVFFSRTRPGDLVDLREYALERLGDRFASASCGQIVAEYLHNQKLVGERLHVHAYGEISDRCAEIETTNLNKKLAELGISADVNFDYSLCPDTLECLERIVPEKNTEND